MLFALSSGRLLASLLLLLAACTQLPTESANTASLTAERQTLTAPDTTGYEYKPAADPNGISKYYQGRQIAHVMGHEGADWLERNDRGQEEGTDLLLRELHLKPTDVVADLGAGTGYFTFRMAPLVPQGRVLAVDIQPEMIAELQKNKAQYHATNVEPIQSNPQNPRLPADSVDLVLVVDAYHEFDYPREMMRAVRAALTPTGRVALVEYRAEDPSVPIKRLHKLSIDQARKEMSAVGLQFVESIETLPQQHLMIFRKAK